MFRVGELAKRKSFEATGGILEFDFMKESSPSLLFVREFIRVLFIHLGPFTGLDAS